MSGEDLKRSVMIAGGTGFVGSALAKRLAEMDFHVTVLSRHPRPKQGHIRYVTWAPQDPESAATLLVPVMDETSFVINLAGASVVGRKWDDDYKQEILGSRILATRALVRAMELAEKRPSLFISASAVGYYGLQPGEAPVDETAPAGSDFLAEVCRYWEQEAQRAETLGVGTVRLRIGVVLGRGGGALGRMLFPFKVGLGGPVGSGKQLMSWIHLDDLVGLIVFLLGLPKMSGPVNAVAPHAVTNKDFSRSLARVLRRPAFLRTPAVLVRLAMGEMSSLFLEGQNVTPRLALGAGYQFKHPEIDRALRDLLIQ